MLPDDLEMLDRTARLVKLDFCPQLSLEEIVAGLTRPHVAIVADSASCACRAGQVAVLSCAVQIAQLGVSLELSLPAHQPSLLVQTARGSLRDATVATVKAIRPDSFSPGRKHPDSEIVIGSSSAPIVTGVPRMYLGGDGFTCRMSRQLPSDPWSGDWPFGGVAAGAIAAAEIFSTAVHGLGAENLSPNSQIDLQERKDASFALPPLSPSEAAVGRADFVSAGAITNGAFFTLLEVPDLKAHLRVFDDDVVGLSNLNRCGVFGRSSLGCPKVAALAQYESTAVLINGVQARLDEDTLVAYEPLADAVCIGTDSVAARWQIQRHAPGWVCVGATSHLMGLVSRHRSGDPCAGCLHPRDEEDGEPIPTVSFVSTMAGMLQAYSLLGRRKLGGGADLLYPHALGSADAFAQLPLAANPSCPVGCSASQSLNRAGLNLAA